MNHVAYIEDHVVPQLFTSAIEAYEFKHQNHVRGKAYDKIETFGLLWGYTLPEKGAHPSRTVATMATVETSALRHSDWVKPNFDSLISKKEFFEKYWPHIEIVGSFHSHPYEDLPEVNNCKGWRASDGDKSFWPYFHEEVVPEQEHLIHLIVAITRLEKKGWAYPDRLANNEYEKGYVLSAENRKLWMRAYSTKMILDDDDEEDEFTFSDNIRLEIPALQKRFL